MQYKHLRINKEAFLIENCITRLYKKINYENKIVITKKAKEFSINFEIISKKIKHCFSRFATRSKM